MKKSVLAFGVTSAFALAGTAHAQSAVTLYGLIDAGITYTNNQGGSSNVQAQSGAVNGSRWGLRGSEDLGNGLKAVFVLENGFNIMNGKLGQGSREFGRQAYVGLSSNQFGTITLGRQYDSVVDYLGPFALTGTQYGGTQAAHPFDNDNLDNSFRVNNAVKYQSVDLAGLKVGGVYGFSNASGGFATNRAYSVGASYAYGPFKFGAGYLHLNNSGTNLNSSGAVSDDATFTASTQQTWGAGANYTFGAATVGLVFTQTVLSNLTGVGSSASGTSSGLTLGADSARFTNYELNGRYQFTPAISVSGAYTYTNSHIAGVDPKWNQFTLQTDYALSKRTDVYLQGVYQHVSDTGSSGIHAVINGLSTSDSNSQVALTVGLRHRF
ncbi:porin [Trinickia caryophylli]|uniref:Porin, GBP family n=1 Tax=Trinickia caryophylli TaxID=28094 RepID=A0A1X7FVU0_TRICW|nr:porin [Trinickia caryophylli]PMS11816.1 porin [Trinickia caryophylli]TRX17499.1 porin [Trinickia caryophylli]WQE11755.1 porin [Trinickia caryophylli]SMF59636.1 porin, GBP family [Trinickia caryophylli]GLU34747.1 porin [Trinickia caryophylli]